ncbi:MAG: hypothetical protein P8179_21785 [Candidatus Thiodiazotropha sp.]
MGDFDNSSKLRRKLVLMVFKSLSSGKSFLETFVELNHISSMIFFLEGLIQFPSMPDNFKDLEDELNDVAKEEIVKLQSTKSLFFASVVEKYNNRDIDAVPMHLTDILWLLIDEGNLEELVNLLPDGTKLRLIENLLNMDLSEFSDIQRNEILRYRESYVG